MLFDAHCRRAGCYSPVPSPRMSLLPPVAFVAFVALIAFVVAVHVLPFADALLLVITTGGEGAGAVGLGVRGGDGDGGLQALLLLLLLLSLSLLLGAKPFDDTVASTTTQQTRTMINV
jgi:hypothetical protein